MFKYSFKHTKARYKALGLKLGYKVREPSGYEVRDRQGQLLYIMKNRKEVEVKLNQLEEIKQLTV